MLAPAPSRSPGRRLLAGVLVLASGVLAGRAAEATERANTLFLGPDLRARPQERVTDAPVYELGLPHGLASSSGQTMFVARVGMVIPTDDGPLAFPVHLGLRYSPLQGRLRPFGGAEVGGYLVEARGPRPVDSRPGPQWCWGARALAGTTVVIAGPLSMHLYVDAAWTQLPEDSRSRRHVFSGLGAGAELHLAFAPHFRVVDMLLHGTDAPEGF